MERENQRRVNSENLAKITEHLPRHGPSTFSFVTAYPRLTTTTQTTPVLIFNRTIVAHLIFACKEIIKTATNYKNRIEVRSSSLTSNLCN